MRFSFFQSPCNPHALECIYIAALIIPVHTASLFACSYIVPAHVGIEGNEHSDRLAKLGCLKPENARVLEPLPDNVVDKVVRDADGQHLGAAEVEKKIREVEVQEAQAGNAYVRRWNQEDGEEELQTIDKHASTGYLRRAKQGRVQNAWSTANRVRKCQAGTLMTGKQRFKCKMQKTPYCTICRLEGRGDHISDVTHILGGCANPGMRSLHNKRHDAAVDTIYHAITHGYRGSAKVLRDTGKEVDQAQRERHTLPQYMFREQVHDRRKVKRPDIVVIPRLPAQADIPITFQPRRGGESMKVVLVEVSYTNLTNMNNRAQEKRRKYEETLTLLEAQGWEPELITVILGTLGEITIGTRKALQEHLGVRKESLEKLLADLHGVALKHMDQCIGMERTLHGDAGMPEGMEGTHKRAYKRGRRQGITRTGTMKKRQKTQRDTQEAEMDVEGSPRTESPPQDEEGKRTRTQGITRVGTVRKRRK